MVRYTGGINLDGLRTLTLCLALLPNTLFAATMPQRPEARDGRLPKLYCFAESFCKCNYQLHSKTSFGDQKK
jgi:hypothetical protein